MSEPMPSFGLLRPDTVDEAVAALAGQPSARACAGGTDLIVNIRRGLAEPETLIDLTRIAEMRRIESDGDGIRIGAGVTLRDLAESADLTEPYSVIRQAALSVAGPGHRNAATVGGNLCLDTRCLYYNQSHWWRKSNDFCLKYRGDICHVAPAGKRCRAAFSGDLAPAFLVLGAEIGIAGPQGRRRLPLAGLYREDGADHLTLGPAEIVTDIHVPTSRARSAYGKIRIRGAIDFPLAGVAVACERDASGAWQVALAVTGTNSCPLMIDPPGPLADGDDAEAYFAALGKAVQKAVSPQRTTAVAAHYRRLSAAALAVRLARNLIDG